MESRPIPTISAASSTFSDLESAPNLNLDNVPKEDSEEFKGYIARNASPGFFTPESRHCSTWEDAPNPMTFASFGDEGVTATVNAYGHLLQFSQYLGVGSSGVFSVDQAHVSEPFYVAYRAEQLQELYATRDVKDLGYGLRLHEAEFDSTPSLKYVNGRWPRYEYEIGPLHITIQWTIHSGTVLQQFLVTNGGKDRTLHFSFNNDMLVRDLDFLEHPEFHGTMNWSQKKSVPGPHGYGCIHILDVERREKVIPENNKDETGAPGTERPSTEAGVVRSVATVVSVFINGEAQKGVGEKNGEWSYDLGCGKSVEVTVAYKMVLLPQPKLSWEDFVIPVGPTNVNAVLRGTSSSSDSISSIKIPDFGIDEDSKDANREDTLLQTDPVIQEAKDRGIASFGAIGDIWAARSMETARLRFPSDHIGFVVNRHLEHILSVCAIPVQPVEDEKPQTSTETMAPTNEAETSRKYAPIALTCGDISGHRVSTSASFFAFWFLIEISRRLMRIENELGVERLRDRIYEVCRGYMEWLRMAWKQTQKRGDPKDGETDLKSEERPKPRGFVANYWVTGDVMPFSDSTWTPANSVTDSAFQLIKVGEFAKIYQSNEDKELAKSIMQDVGTAWAEELDSQDKRRASAWVHGLDEYVSVFRLDDHVWIWKALKSMQDMKTVRWNSGLAHPEVETSIIYKLATKRNFQETFQEELLRKFTTVNDFSGKRMLAVTRSARETRFFLHARDTALFYGLDWELALEQKPYRDVWENTIEAQMHHDESQLTNWDNAIRLGLAVVLGCQGKTINDLSPVKLVTSALHILLGSTGSNAFFPGQLDINTKRPMLFEEEEFKDFYFHASFEIPFILLRFSDRITELYNQPVQSTAETKGKEAVPAPTKHNLSQEVEEIVTSQPKWQQMGPDGKRGPRNVATMMRKKMPFYSMLDSSNIVELDEEWLYNCPAFLLREGPIGIREIRDQMRSIAEESGNNGSSTGVVARGAQNCPGSKADGVHVGDESQVLFSAENIRSWVLDLPKRKRKRGKRDSGDRDQQERERFFFNEELWQWLNKAREAEKAKKRFLWLYDVNPETALACYLASPDGENSAMSEFFDRHARHEQFFSDDTTRVLNTWDTEFHVSFYQLVNKSCPPLRNALPTPNERSFPTNPRKKITQASMGFRFFGDFFDRYWTCHFIQHVPARISKYNHIATVGNPLLVYLHYVEHDRAWWQRKVLELILVDRILAEALQSTQEILDEARKELDVNKSNALMSILSSDDYFASKAQLQSLQDVLQLIEDELSLLLDTLSKWDTREKDRGHEQPRWTRKDEVRYRGRIRKLQVSTSRQTRQLRTCRAKIVTVKQTLAASQDKVRDDLGLLGSENIRLFTYVTVVFLPLGFAASIFSMSGVPNRGLITSMALCAMVALALTVVALFNAKSINAIFDVVSRQLHSYSSTKMQETTLARTIIDRSETDITNTQPDHADASPPQPTERDFPRGVSSTGSIPETIDSGLGGPTHLEAYSSSWHIWFWIAYLFIELPPRRVLLAYDTMKNGDSVIGVLWYLLTGLLLLPLFVVSWFVQVVAYNLVDGLRLLWSCVVWIFSAPVPKNKTEFEDRLGRLTHPTKPCRPLKKLINNVGKSADPRR
ncbi:hypothetical protein K458DRAFT_492750 [Lentithecium fluviatile CBS 122367]|uniref:Uncharacterized protein n=1 Tax=Lentithecium fluviatile CBS 122367 TaxID=1168545 RepID=A0A6G1IDK7_9PLEO|nr:hypothetical protein K458DRAFT_492750 [Lentithecium fluviatile CBS 122367]